MSQYSCIDELIRKLSDAVDEVTSCALAYEGEGPYRVPLDDLTDEHGFDRQYIPLLTEMIKERIPGMDTVTTDDEIILHTHHLPGQAPLLLTRERAATLLDSALEWIGKSSSGLELYDILTIVIGMTDEEIHAAGFYALSGYFEKPQPPAPEIDPYEDAPDFCSRMTRIPGIAKGNLAGWVEHAFDMATIDEEDGVPREEARKAALDDFADAFERIERHYGNGIAAEIFNSGTGYVAYELYGAAEFAANGGDVEAALEMARLGMFEGAKAPDEESAAQDFFMDNGGQKIL